MEKLIHTKNFDFKVTDSGLVFDESMVTGEVKFKKSYDMNPLLRKPFAEDDGSWNYVFVNGVYHSEEEKRIYEEKGMMNGITVLNTGDLNGEVRKNSGHYHGFNEGHVLPYAEIYEIIYGKAAFFLQEADNFLKDEELNVKSMRMVVVNAGEKIVIPAFCAHCAMNIGDDMMAFYNLAVPCPLHYEPITNHKGFGYYILKKGNVLVAVKNPNYPVMPELEVKGVKPSDELNLFADKTVFEMFAENNDAYDYLGQPEECQDAINKIFY